MHPSPRDLAEILLTICSLDHADTGRERELRGISKCGNPRLSRKPRTASPAVRTKEATRQGGDIVEK